jgi:hypothetical protein
MGVPILVSPLTPNGLGVNLQGGVELKAIPLINGAIPFFALAKDPIGAFTGKLRIIRTAR